MGESSEPKGRTLKEILMQPENPLLDAANKHADERMDRAASSDAIRVIEELETEVRGMTLANRFSRKKT